MVTRPTLTLSSAATSLPPFLSKTDKYKFSFKCTNSVVSGYFLHPKIYILDQNFEFGLITRCSSYRTNFSAMTRLDQNRAAAQLALKAGVEVGRVSNVTIWGNHSSTQFPDAEHATIDGKPVTEVIKDAAWLQTEFVPTVQKRGAAVIAARKLSSAMSAAKAACDHMASWWQGTTQSWVSMAVISDGSYDTPPGVMFSFPVTVADKEWSIVTGLNMSDFARAKLAATGAELCEEREEAMAVCSQ